EAKIDAPPFYIRNGQKLWSEPLEIYVALAERPVGTGFVGVERAVGINQMDGANAASQQMQKFPHAARERLLRAMLPRTYYAAHVCMRGIEHHAEVGVVDALMHG